MSEDLQFEQIDADAVCEQCGTVNPEETLLCRACGNNLKEQRQRRIAQTYATPATGTNIRQNSVRALTGLLSVLGLLVVLFVVLNLSSIEAALFDAMSGQETTAINLHGGAVGATLDELEIELRDFPSSGDELWGAVQNSIVETSFNGRYTLISPNNLRPRGIVGEANLRKEGDTIYFVVSSIYPDLKIRGVAQLETTETGIRAVVSNTASVVDQYGSNTALGYSAPLEGGGYVCIGQTNADNSDPLEVWAFRVR